MFKILSKKINNYWPFLFILIVWLIFAHPYFLKDRAPFPSDYQVNNFSPWSSYQEFWGPVKNAAMPDIITQIYPWRHFTIEIWKNKEIPLWNPYSFSGTPHLANYQSAVFSPLNILFFLFSFIDAWSFLVLLQFLLAGLFAYIFARSLKIEKAASLVSSISFMFCGFIVAWSGYATLGYAILFLPLSLFAIEKYFQTRKIFFLILLTLSIPFAFFSGHFQISLYFLAFIIFYLVYKFFVNKDLDSSFRILLSIFIGLLLSAPQILPSVEFYSQSRRSDLFQKGEFIPWKYLVTFIAPDFFGNPVTRNDWFGHWAEWNAYIGVLPLFLAFYAILKLETKRFGFFIIAAIFSLLLAFDTPLLDFLINLHLPVVSTSAASRIIVLFSFSAAMLSGFGLDRLISDFSEKKIGKIFASAVVFALFFLGFWIFVLAGGFWDSTKNLIARNNLILPTFIFLAGLVLIFAAFFKKKIINFAIFGILVLVSFDLLRFAFKWQSFDPKNLVFAKTPITDFYSKISGYDRVFGNFQAEDSVYYGLPGIEGYDPLYIKRYGEFIASVADGKLKQSYRSVVSFPKDSIYSGKIFDFLGVKYLVHKVSDGHAVWAYPFWTYPADQFKLIFDDGRYQVFENSKSFKRAFLVGKYRVILAPEEILSTIFDNNFNLQEEVVLEQDPGVQASDNLVGLAEITKYTRNRIEIKTDSNTDSTLVLTDSFYPGWKAFVDGKITPIIRANYAFRAISVPKGLHVVEFQYKPFSFFLGLYLAGIGALGIFFLTFSFFNRKP